VVTPQGSRFKRPVSSLLILTLGLIALMQPAFARHGRPAHLTCVEVREFVRVAGAGDWDAAERVALSLPGYVTPQQVATARKTCEFRR
jgi:hypothetical protein